MLRLAARGATNKAIAGALGVALQTTKNEMHAAFLALDVCCRIDAFRVLGWLVVPE